MRAPLPLLAVLAVGACGPGARTRPTPPTQPAAFVVDSGVPVRVRLATDERLTGRLLAPFRPDSPELLLCDTAVAPDPCASSTGPDVRRLPVAELAGVAVRDRSGGSGTILGLFAGAVAGGVALRDDSGGGFALGGLLGLGVGPVIGARRTGWVPLFPCGPHGPCKWRGVWPAASPPDR